MSHGYVAIQWNSHKRCYDAIVASAVVAYLGVFLVVGKLMWQGANAISDEVLAIRGLGSCAFVMLHVVLAIGPLARLDPRFLPVLANRRHLGVLTFVVALAHGLLSVGYYHGFGVLNPLLSVLTINQNVLSLHAFPFELLGLLALVVLFLLAATSHDFWLKALSARAWKSLHMSVYFAYALLVAHVALGALQTDRGSMLAILVGAGLVGLSALHVAASRRESIRDRVASSLTDGWIDAGDAGSIPENRARIVTAPNSSRTQVQPHARGDVRPDRIAVFRHAGGFSAVTNVCAHQGGPLGEGRVIDGCITCPWHGWQYKPADGCAPPPFLEKIATHQVRIVAGRILVNPHPLPPGTAVTPATLASEPKRDV